MVVLPIDDGNIGGHAPQRSGGFQPAEAGADNDHFGKAFRH
jgi:hypothetical protein